MNKEEKARCDKNWEWSKTYWARKSKQFKIEDWKFEKNHMKRALAITNYTQKKICVSSYLLRGKSCNEQKMRNTILHEIAHVFAGHKNGHNSKWKEIALKIGCSGEICGSMTYIPPSYLMYCPKGCFKKDYFRKPNIQGRLCKKCHSKPKIKSF